MHKLNWLRKDDSHARALIYNNRTQKIEDYLSVFVCSSYSGSATSSFLIDFIAYTYLLSFFSTSITLPYAPRPRTFILIEKHCSSTLIKTKSSIVTYSSFLLANRVFVLARISNLP